MAPSTHTIHPTHRTQRQVVRVKGRHGTFHLDGPDRSNSSLWVYGPIDHPQRQWAAVPARDIRPAVQSRKRKPKKV